jgi:fructokinase
MQNQPTQQPRIGIDLGGTKIELIIMQGDGAISHRQRCDTPQSDYQATLTALNSLITESASKAGLPDKLPIGIGTPGAVSLKTGLMMNCNSTSLNDQPLREDLEKRTGRPVRIANDADCFALSEASDGVGSENSTVFGVILGTGVGGGIVLNKRLNQGVNAISGEWGHNTLPIHALKYPLPASLLESPRLCFCGRQHCVETWIAGPAFEKNFRLQFGESATAPEIMQLVRSGDPLSIMVFEQYQHLLALGLANVINILDPAAIVLGGGLSNIDELYENIPGLLPHYVFSDVIHTKILKAKYGDSSGVRGAAWLWTTREVKQILESS